MHATALRSAASFFETYVTSPQGLIVVDLGSQDVNGSLRQVCPAGVRYIGVDHLAGKNVDLVLEDPYSLPLRDETVDLVLCSSVLEHSEFFWLTFLELLRILKPHGLCYLNVPSNGPFHRYPTDNWRFYPDSGVALQNWARRNGRSSLLLESFVTPQETGLWNDFVAVFLKDESQAMRFPQRMFGRIAGAENGHIAGQVALNNPQALPEDLRRRAEAARLSRFGDR